MKRSTTRILTTHAGSLPRPDDLLEMLKAKEIGEPYDRELFDRRLAESVAEYVRLQAENGMDIVTDGELSKPSFVYYVRNRIKGMEGINTSSAAGFQGLFADFPGYPGWLAEQQSPRTPIAGHPGVPECIGPLSWKDRASFETDIANLKAALKGVNVEEAFMPSPSVGIVAQRIFNAYYPTYEAYVEAITAVMAEEYNAIVDAGFLLQIDAPEMVMDKNGREFHDQPMSEYRKRMGLWVEALNTAMKGIPEDRIRFHICWGNNEGPHTHDVPLKDVVDIMLRVNAEAYSVEAANPRHEHEWKLWRDVKLPDGKILIPGVIDSTTNFVEHPELVADRILQYANIVGRENIIAGTDCGFATMALRGNAVYTPIVWAKLKALSDGAQIASKELWR